MGEKKPRNALQLDDILDEIGAFGKFQWMTIALVIFPVMFSAFPGSEYVFTASVPRHRCLVPECSENATSFVLEPPWLEVAIPHEDDAFDTCQRYEPTEPGTESCTASDFSDNRIPCETFVHDRTNTVVVDFGLECEDWLRSLIGMFNSIGTLLVLPITGYISDRWGRRVALTINAINTCVIGFIRSFSVNYEMYLVLHLIGTTLGAGAFSSAYIIVTELVAPNRRTLVGVIMSSFFAVGQVVYGFLAWGVQPWKILIMVSFAPQIFVVAYFWIVPESVRWLMSKEKFEEAEKILKRAAKVNGREIQPESLEALEDSAKAAAQAQLESVNVKETSLFKQVFRSPTMLRRMCTLPIWWMTTTLVYYGMSINAVGLSGNMYLNFIAVCAIEIPGYATAYFIMGVIGRKITLSVLYFLCAVCQFAFPFIPEDLSWLSLIVYLLGKFAISGVFTTMYIFTAELLPTRNRHSLLAFSSMIGRIGSITAPLTPALQQYWHGIPSYIFGTMAVISGSLVLTQPETINTKFPDTIEEAEKVGQKV